MRNRLMAAVAALVAVTAVVTGAGTGAGAGFGALLPGLGGTAYAAGPAAEADLAYHGRVALSGGRLGVWLVPENHGPTPLANATVRLRLSADLATAEPLEGGCARTGPRTVVCETGALPARGPGRHIAVVLPLRVPVSEVAVRIDTLWNGGASDRNVRNNQHVVLALDTGDMYAF
jgi:hypothetical protein